MKTQSFLAGVLLLAGAGLAQAVPYTDIYDVFQGGYDGGEFPGTARATIWITDNDSDGLISLGDFIRGSMDVRRPIGNGQVSIRGFEITGITGASILTGGFQSTQ